MSPSFTTHFNSLDSGLLLGSPTAKKDAGVRSNNPGIRTQTPSLRVTEDPEHARSATPSAGAFFRFAMPAFGSLLAPSQPKASSIRSFGPLRELEKEIVKEGLGGEMFSLCDHGTVLSTSNLRINQRSSNTATNGKGSGSKLQPNSNSENRIQDSTDHAK